ncbi:hypothetical protein CLV46_1006 [Diaminobutyricimonas aerilata]|uniref:Uncharacterized protein n=1 Tax=Diaminobutyricimonas aerilata TaxID=1162967 RepID=A0A2M9CHU7_9MICO|nr:hypothetical protein CLV46_1006 [Diaminobutyricimonas aerilata]
MIDSTTSAEYHRVLPLTAVAAHTDIAMGNETRPSSTA